MASIYVSFFNTESFNERAPHFNLFFRVEKLWLNMKNFNGENGSYAFVSF